MKMRREKKSKTSVLLLLNKYATPARQCSSRDGGKMCYLMNMDEITGMNLWKWYSMDAMERKNAQRREEEKGEVEQAKYYFPTIICVCLVWCVFFIAEYIVVKFAKHFLWKLLIKLRGYKIWCEEKWENEDCKHYTSRMEIGL